jgi:thiamine-monophosphate kinase
MHRERRWRGLLPAQYYPPVRIELGEWLARRGRQARHAGLASAMMDLSDGLSTDLARLCAASGVGAKVHAERVPAVKLPAELVLRGFDRAALALHGGEDYELLFTVPQRLAYRVPKSLGGVRLTCIGEITRARNIVLVEKSGRARSLVAKGWDHFGKQKRERKN